MKRLRLPATALAVAWMFGFAWWAGSARSESSTGPTIEKTEVGTLIASLDDSRSAVRREAMVRLARLGPSAVEAIPSVTNRLADEDPYVRAHAARAACRMGASPDVAVKVLTLLLQPDDPQLCCLAALILGEIGSTARPALAMLHSCMKVRDASIRLHAAEAILKIDSIDAAALRELLAGMEGESADQRYLAANALGETVLDNEQAIFALQKALTDGDMNVAITAALNLSKRFHLPRAGAANVPETEELGRLIESLRDPSPVMRQMAAIRLGMAGPAARRAGVALLDRLNDPDPSVRVHVAHALWKIERPAGVVVPVLVDLLGIASSNVRFAATHVLGEIGAGASDALPALYDMFAGSRLRDRLLLSMVICLIDPRDREMVGILVVGLHEQAGDVRYQSAIALGSAPVAHQRRVEKALTQAGDDRNLRVQAAAAEALGRFELRIHEARNALSEQYASNFAESEASPATDTPVVDEPLASLPPTPDTADRIENPTAGDGASSQPDSLPPVGKIAQSDVPKPNPESFEDPDEGLKDISQVSASIRPPRGEEPPDYAMARFASVPVGSHGLGKTRGWSPITYGWDAPAMYYKPVYFEDINHERYGIHYGLGSPFISFGKFFWDMTFLPYKLAVQPMCECHYTLGFERPNNCVPVHCFGCPCPTSLLWWCSRHNYCPTPAACPWTRECRPCNPECPSQYDPALDQEREFGNE